MKATFFIAQLIVLLSFVASGQDQNIVDSLTSRLQENLHDTDLINTLNDVAWKLRYTNPDTAITLSSEALSIAEAIDWQQGIVDSKNKLGTFHRLKGDYTLALEYYFMALKMNEALSKESQVAVNLSNIGIVYKNQGEYAKALDYHFKALKIDEELGRKRGLSANYGSIGNIRYFQGDYSKALEYNFKALAINEELNNRGSIAINLGNLGNVFYDQGKYAQALEYYLQAVEMNEQLGNKSLVSIFQGNIGSLYTKIGEFEKAEIILQEAINLSRVLGAKGNLKYQHKFLSNLYDTTNRPAQALKAFKSYITYRDSIVNEENTKAQTRTEMKYEYEKAELVKEQKEREAARVEAEILSRRDNLQYSVILLGFLVLGSLILGLGKLSLSDRIAEGLIFFSFLIFFEFILVLADPYIEGWSGGAPGIKLLFNAGIAALIFPLHSLFETKLKKRLAK